MWRLTQLLLLLQQFHQHYYLTYQVYLLCNLSLNYLLLLLFGLVVLVLLQAKPLLVLKLAWIYHCRSYLLQRWLLLCYLLMLWLLLFSYFISFWFRHTWYNFCNKPFLAICASYCSSAWPKFSSVPVSFPLFCFFIRI